jgi:hypothetical protein
LLAEQAEKLSEHGRACFLGVGIGQGRAGHRVASEMIMMMRVSVPIGFQGAQAPAPENCEKHGNEMIPAQQALGVAVALMTRHDPLKAAARKIF